MLTAAAASGIGPGADPVYGVLRIRSTPDTTAWTRGLQLSVPRRTIPRSDEGEVSILDLTNRETWTLVHGLILGSLFLLSFAGGLAGLWSLRPELVTTAGIRERMQRLVIGTSAMAVLAWATVITGTWVVYPWYREKLAGDDLSGCAGAQGPGPNCSPRDYLLSGQGGNTEDWHEFGMEWKEHIAWIAPMLATVAAFLVIYYGADLAKRPRLRWMTIAFFTAAFLIAGIAGVFGALITKAAPVQ